MNLTALPSHSLRGGFGPKTFPGIPGDKSISHRAALFAGMAKGNTRIHNFMTSGVTMVMLEALSQLGVKWRLTDNELNVTSRGFNNWEVPDKPLFCGNSATTMRLLAGALSASGIPAVLDGTESLRKRPMDRIIYPLQAMGVPIHGTLQNTAPLIISAREPSKPLVSLTYTLQVASAQVKTCLLLAALGSTQSIELCETQLSRDHTERMLRWLGVPVSSTLSGNNHIVHMGPGSSREIPAFELAIPGDFSSAAFLIVSGLIIPNSEIILSNIGLNETRTGLLDALKQMGAEISTIDRLVTPEPEGDILVKSSLLNGINIQGDLVVRMIDEFPIFSIAAINATGSTTIRDAKELRYKETDRISSLCAELMNIGVSVDEFEDGFKISGSQQIVGGVVDPHRDHRLAMSLTVGGLISQNGVKIQNAEIINESFPQFIEILRSSGAQITVLEDTEE